MMKRIGKKEDVVYQNGMVMRKKINNQEKEITTMVENEMKLNQRKKRKSEKEM